MGFDELDEDETRLLEVRGMLALLADYGLAGRVCKMYDVTDEDLERLALVEMERRRLAKEKAGGDQANG